MASSAGVSRQRGRGPSPPTKKIFNPPNRLGAHILLAGSKGGFELWGVFPLRKLKNHLFYFGAFNPTWNHSWVAPAKGSGLFNLTGGEIERQTRIWDYSAKLTWQLNAKHSIESLIFADPSVTNPTSFASLNIDNTTANSALDYG